MNDDNLERRLNDAGERLRDDAPDDIAATQAFRRRHDRTADRTTPSRNWWPALAGIGLIGAAIIGVIAYGSFGPDDAILTPTDTAVTTENNGTTADTAVTIPSSTTLAGDPQEVSVGTAAPDSNAPPEVDASASVGTPPLPTTTTPGAPACETGDVPPAGAQFLIVSCRNVGDTFAVLVAQVPEGESTDAATRWFVNSSRWPDGVIELGPASPVSGPIADTISFLPVLDNGVTCIVIVQTASGEWKEDCWLDAPIPQVVTDFDGAIVQFDLTDPSAVVSQPLSHNELRSSGCSVTDVGELAARSASAGALYVAVGCDDTTAAIVASSIFMQPGGPDGSIWLYERVDDTWQMVDNGTGIDTDLPVPIPPREKWAAWPGDLNPRSIARDLGEVNSLPLLNNLRSVEAVADAVLSIIDDERGPEFTGPLFPLEIVEIDGDLIVIESIDGADDSSAGTAHFIHVAAAIDDGAYSVTHWYTSGICARGGGPDLCI